MRIHAALLALGAVAVLAGALQVVSDGAAGTLAAAPSLPRALAATVGDGPAHALLAALPEGNLRALAEGRLALAGGDDAVASRLLVAAGDAVATQVAIDRIDAAGDYRRARTLALALVAHLQRNGGDRTVRADALWRLGQLDAELGYRQPALRRTAWLSALDAYRQALALIPLSVTILLAAGNQALLVGDRAAAAGFFERALASDPSSDAARDGLVRARTGIGLPPPFVAPAEWRRAR